MSLRSRFGPKFDLHKINSDDHQLRTTGFVTISLTWICVQLPGTLCLERKEIWKALIHWSRGSTIRNHTDSCLLRASQLPTGGAIRQGCIRTRRAIMTDRTFFVSLREAAVAVEPLWTLEALGGSRVVHIRTCPTTRYHEGGRGDQKQNMSRSHRLPYFSPVTPQLPILRSGVFTKKTE